MTADDQAFEGRLRADWQAGLLKPRLLAIRYNLTQEAIERLAEAGKWGPHGSLREAIDRSTMSALVDRVNSSHSPSESADGGVLIDSQEQIDVYGQKLAGIVVEQQAEISRGRKLASRLLGELEELAPPIVDHNAIQSLANAVDEHQPELAKWLREQGGSMSFDQKIQFLRQRIGMLNGVAGIQQTYIGLEREAWGLNANRNPNDGGSGGGVDALIDAARQSLESPNG